MKNQKIRIDKYLSNMGVGSRSEVKKYIKNGFVRIEEKVITDPGFLVDTEEKVLFADRVIEYKEFIYLMMNKPQGVISATEDHRERTVLDLLDKIDTREGIFPAGRLDKDTEGLLLLTNDGKLAHNMLSPKKHVEKEYYAKVQGILTTGDEQAFSDGITLEDGTLCMPALLSVISTGEISEVYITIREGKYHQIKRMFESLGKKVIYLKRLRMGDLKLDERLALGEYRELSEDEMQIIRQYQ